MGKITLRNIRLYAYHGCLAEETVVGSEYRVDLIVDANLTEASQSDLLEDTVDYVQLQQLVREEMAIPSKLLEHVAWRINTAILEAIPRVKQVEVTVAKLNPPLGGDVESVAVSLSSGRP